MKITTIFHSYIIKNYIVYISLQFLLYIIFSYFTLLNLRISINSTNILILSIILFALFNIHLYFNINKKYKCIILVFSTLLSIANNIGSHIIIGQAPYNDLIDKSCVTSYGWPDIIGIIIINIVLYRCIIVIINLITYVNNKLYKNDIFFTQHINFAIPMLIMLLCWLPYFILYYPGFIFGDSVGQIKQAIGIASFSNHHPVFHTLLIQICIKIGNMLRNINFGCAIYTIIQMLYISFSLSKLVEWLSQHNVPFLFICITTGVYAVMPYFGQTSIAMWKDPWFGSSLVLLTISILKFNSIVENIGNEDNKTQKKCLLEIFIFSLLACLFRNNGVYALAFTSFFILIIVIFKKNNRNEFIKLLANFLSVICLYFVITGPVYLAFKVAPTEKVESLGICVNQMARVAASDDGVMSDKERNFMNNILPIEKYKTTYRPCVVDLLKWNPNFNGNYLNSPDFFKIYISMGLKNPGKYFCAWTLMTFGYWAPNRWELNNDSGNLNKGNLSDVLTSGLPIKVVNQISPPDSFLYKVFPIQGTILSLGMVDWILLFSVLMLLLKGDIRKLIAINLSVGVMITMFIASPYWYWQRYGMTQYYLFPIYLYFIASNFNIKNTNI